MKTMYDKKAIIEIYDCVQGEGKMTGSLCTLVRMSGCPLRCSFNNSVCDTSYASWHPEKGLYSVSDVIAHMKKTKSKRVMVTGGEPLMHKEICESLFEELNKLGIHITVETCGAFGNVDTSKVDLISISPKLTSSIPTGESEEIVSRHVAHMKNYKAMAKMIMSAKANSKEFQLKFVISDDDDISEAMDIVMQIEVAHTVAVINDRMRGNVTEELIIDPALNVYFMPEGSEADQLDKIRGWLIARCISEGVNYSDRIHIVAYGNERFV